MLNPAGPRIIVIPDLQVKPGLDMAHLEWMADYVADKKPDTVLQIGDWFDMPSLSSYDRGKKSAEGRRYKEDIEAGTASRSRFERRLKARRYKPRRKVFTLGNHENRIARAIEDDAKMDGQMGFKDLGFEKDGWEVFPFLAPVDINGVVFSHYFPVNAQGRVTQDRNGCPSARVQGQRLQRSCVSGHLQGLDHAFITTPFGLKRSIIAGSAYRHDEVYLTPQGNVYWRGILSLNDVQPDGYFDLIEVSLRYLERKYG